MKYLNNISIARTDKNRTTGLAKNLMFVEGYYLLFETKGFIRSSSFAM
jgi:hypothetical protein